MPTAYPPEDTTSSTAPVAGLALVLLLIAVALLPNSGAVPAQTGCVYNCTGTDNGNVALTWYALLAVLVVVAAVLGLLLFMRRRRGVGGAAPPAIAEWTESSGGPVPGGAEGPQMGAESAGAAAYLEGPEDVGHTPPEGAVPEPPAEPASTDIDSLMQELDKISGEILKRGKPGDKAPDSSADSTEEDADK